MQITEQQFIENFEALPEEEKSMVETILTQTPPEAIRALATVMGVSLQMTEEPPQEPVQEPQEPMEEPTEEITEPEQEVPQTDEMSPVERQMMALGDQPTEPVATTGPINVEGKDDSGIADDIPMEAQNDSFVVNVEALKKFGYGDFIERIIKPNLKSLEERTGIMIELAEITQPQQQVQGEVPIAISNKEIYIPRMLAEEIGYDLLEKINNRGKKQTEKKLAERKKEQPEASPQQQMQAAVGKRIEMSNGGGIEERKMQVQSYLKSKRLRNEVVAGIMGNIHGENSKFIFTQEEEKPKNPKEVGYGLFQLTDRGGKGHRSSYFKYLEATNKTDSMKSQIDYVIDMINQKPDNPKLPSHFRKADIGIKFRKKLRQIFKTGSVEDVTNAFLDMFERPDKKIREKSRPIRIREAKRIFKMLSSQNSTAPIPKEKPRLAVNEVGVVPSKEELVERREQKNPPPNPDEGLTLEQFNIFDTVDEVGGVPSKEELAKRKKENDTFNTFDEVGGIGSKRKTKGSMRPGLDRVKEIEAQRYRDAPRGTMVGDRKV